MPPRVGIIGLHQAEYQEVKAQLFGPVIWHEMLPKIRVEGETLWMQRTNGNGFLPVDLVVYHGIYQDDLDFLSALALWGGRCYPNPYAMMNARLKFPCLVRALRHTRFPILTRGYASEGVSLNTPGEWVAKWGNWHCGENKARFTQPYTAQQSSIIEPFIDGEAIRVIAIGERSWQIHMDGEDWLKSIHSPKAGFMPINEDLLDDTLRIRQGMELDLIANDYLVDPQGQSYLLEVNHIPNVTQFPELWEAFRDHVVDWLGRL
jgi:hypothetical protein